MRTPAVPRLAVVLAAVLASGLVGSASAQTARGVVYHSRTVLRIAPPRLIRDDPALKWEEKKAAKCQPLRSIAAALGTGERHLDLLMRDGTRMRAKFPKSCRGQDFYAGFYVSPTEDGMICANRDVLKARSGMACRIDRFRRLQLDD